MSHRYFKCEPKHGIIVDPERVRHWRDPNDQTTGSLNDSFDMRGYQREQLEVGRLDEEATAAFERRRRNSGPKEILRKSSMRLQMEVIDGKIQLGGMLRKRDAGVKILGDDGQMLEAPEDLAKASSKPWDDPAFLREQAAPKPKKKMQPWKPKPKLTTAYTVDQLLEHLGAAHKEMLSLILEEAGVEKAEGGAPTPAPAAEPAPASPSRAEAEVNVFEELSASADRTKNMRAMFEQMQN